MAPTYKLTYFNATAAGESIRFLFSYGGIPFEDNRIEDDDWPKVKPTTPFGLLPFLEVDGKVITQSLAIARYIAKKVKLVGKDDWENLEIDAAVETVNDLKNKLSEYYWEPNAEAKAALKDPALKETLPFYMERLDKQVAKNNGYLAVGRLTWADLYFVSLLHYLSFITETDILEKSPNLAKLRESVLAIPSIKAWVAKRPKTDM